MKSYIDVEHTTYNSVKTEPLQQLSGKPTWRMYVPLDKPARKEYRDHYLCGWQLSASKPKTIRNSEGASTTSKQRSYATAS